MDSRRIDLSAGLRRGALKCIAVTVVAGLVFWSGAEYGRIGRTGEAMARAVLEEQARGHVVRIAELEQQVVNLRTGSEIDRAAASEVRTELAAATGQIDRLQQEVELFRSLLDSGARTRGLVVHRVEIRSMADAGRYAIRITLLQRAPRHVELTGQLRVSVEGRQADRKRVLDMAGLGMGAPAGGIPLRLVYFQIVEAEMHLPPDFTPEAVHLVARVTAGRPQTLDVRRNWREGEV